MKETTIITNKELKQLEELILSNPRYVRNKPKIGRLSLRSDPVINYAILEKDAGFTRASFLFGRKRVTQEIKRRIENLLNHKPL